MPLSLPIYFLGRTYVLHTRINGRQVKRSLGTANPRIAKLRAIQLLGELHLAVFKNNPSLSDFNFDNGEKKKYEIKIGDALIKAEGEDDHLRAMQALAEIGKIPGGWPRSEPAGVSPEKAMALRRPGKAFEKMADGEVSDPPPTTYTELFEKYKKLKPSITEGTKKDYGGTVKEFDAFADSPMLWEVDDDIITEYIEWLAAKGNGESTIDKKVGALRSLFNFGRKQKYVAGENPAAERNLQTRKQKMAKGHKFYELDEIKEVMGCNEFKKLMDTDMNFYLIAVAALISGIRITALANLTLADLRVSVEGTPYISVQKDKTAAGQRSVPIPKDLHDFMAAFLKKFGSFGFASREDGGGASDPVRKILNKHLEAIGLESKGFTIHGLRKTLNGCLHQDNVDFETRCQFMGHELLHVNSAVYVPGQPMQKKSVDEVGRAVLPTQMKLLQLIGFV